MVLYPLTAGLVALAAAMRQRGHNPADVARATDSDPAVITNILRRRRGVGLKLATRFQAAYAAEGVTATSFSEEMPAGTPEPEFPQGHLRRVALGAATPEPAETP